MTAQVFEPITVETLLDKVRGLRQQGCRLAAISATRLPEQLELTYSFDKEGQLTNLRLLLPAEQAHVPSISSIYWCAFLYENEIHDLFNLQVQGIAVDFKGNLYKTAIPFPFGTTKAPAAKPAAAPAVKPAGPAVPAPVTAPLVPSVPVTRHASPVTA